jgi:hypothetical protein
MDVHVYITISDLLEPLDLWERSHALHRQVSLQRRFPAPRRVDSEALKKGPPTRGWFIYHGGGRGRLTSTFGLHRH